MEVTGTSTDEGATEEVEGSVEVSIIMESEGPCGFGDGPSGVASSPIAMVGGGASDMMRLDDEEMKE